MLRQAFPLLVRVAMKGPREAGRIVAQSTGAGVDVAALRGPGSLRERLTRAFSGEKAQRMLDNLDNVEITFPDGRTFEQRYGMSLSTYLDDIGLYQGRHGLPGTGSAEEMWAEAWPAALGTGAVENVPGLGHGGRAVGAVLRASEGMFLTGADMLRNAYMRNVILDGVKRGLDPIQNVDAYRRVASDVAIHTRRGDFKLPDVIGMEAQRWTNQLVYAMRNKLSAFQEPVRAVQRLTEVASRDKSKAFAAREYLNTLGQTGVAIGLMTAGLYGILKRRYPDAKVETDPRNTNFMRVTAGGKTWDLTGGRGGIYRTLVRMATNTRVTSTGRMEATDPWDSVIGAELEATRHVFQGKAPIAGFVSQVAPAPGNPPVGPGDVMLATLAVFQPFYHQDLAAFAAKSGGGLQGAVTAAEEGGLPGFLGAGLNVPPETKKKGPFDLPTLEDMERRIRSRVMRSVLPKGMRL